ncbi:MAG: class I SAM-dependent methyltransferase, partial [Nocardioidaceae bacterium]
LGENAMFLAGKGYAVTAFDASNAAIERNRAKARAAGSSVRFMVADATSLEGVPGGFTTVVDSAMLHCLTDEQRRTYLDGLRRVCRPAARLHVFCFQTGSADALQMPASMDEASLRHAFRECGWNIHRMQTRRYATMMTRRQAHEQMPEVLRENLIPDLDKQDMSEQEGVSCPVWQITARLA